MEVKLFDTNGFVCCITQDEAKRRLVENADAIAYKRKGVITRLELPNLGRGRGERICAHKTVLQLGGGPRLGGYNGALGYADSNVIRQIKIIEKKQREEALDHELDT